MKRHKELLFNIGIFGLSGFASKALIFFMLPIYTRFLRPEEYGNIELIVSTITIMLPLFTLSVAQGVMRFTLEDDENKRCFFPFGLIVVLIGFIVVMFLFPFVSKIGFIKDNVLYFYIIYFTYSLYDLMLFYAKGKKLIKLVGIASFISIVILVVSNLILLIGYHMGVTGYLISLILSYLFPALILFVYGGMVNDLSIKICNKSVAKEIMSYSIPIAPIKLAWWLNNKACYYIILLYLGYDQVGLFAAAIKIPMILNLFHDVFFQAWLFSAVKEKCEDNSANNTTVFFSEIYGYYNTALVLGASFIIAFIKPIATFLLSVDFASAWVYTPLVVIAVVFNSLSGFVGSIFFVSKKTTMIFLSTLFGGFMSLSFCLILINSLAMMGASIAMLIGSVSVWFIRLISSGKYIELRVNYFHHIICYICLIAQAITVALQPFYISLPISLLLITIMVALNIKEIKILSTRLISITAKLIVSKQVR